MAQKTSPKSKCVGSFLDELQFLLEEDLYEKVKEFSKRSENQEPSQNEHFSAKWIENAIQSFEKLIAEKNEFIHSSKNNEEKLRFGCGYENDHLNLMLEILAEARNSNASNSVKPKEQMIKDFLGRELLKNLISENIEVSNLNKSLQAAVDLRGILFLSIYQSPLNDMPRDQVQLRIFKEIRQIMP